MGTYQFSFISESSPLTSVVNSGKYYGMA